MSAQCIPEYPIPPSPNYKWCPSCNTGIPIDDFGICKSRSDGRNIYCKACIRERMNASRAALRQRKMGRELNVSIPAPVVAAPAEPVNIPRTVKVTEYLKGKPRTFDELVKETKFSEDTLCEVLMTLLNKTEIEVWNVQINDLDFTRWYRLKTI